MFQLLGLLKVIWSNNLLKIYLFFYRLNFSQEKNILSSKPIPFELIHPRHLKNKIKFQS
jgi:hypothetical protein